VDDASDEVFIAPHEAGIGRVNSKFGPEISIGRRIRETTGRRVMVVKYCKGGTNVRNNWNPSTTANRWNYDLDDGTAAFLEPNTIFEGGSDMASMLAELNRQCPNEVSACDESCFSFLEELITEQKEPDMDGAAAVGPETVAIIECAMTMADEKDALFINQVYVVRKVTEALDAAGVAYEWKAFVWLQGGADRMSTWDVFGEDTARLFDAVRNRTVGHWDLPIVDTGAGGNPGGPTGKQYATQLVKGCNVRHVKMPTSVPDPAAGCVSFAGKVCPSFYIPTLWNHFGWDARMNENNTDPNAASSFSALQAALVFKTTNKTFAWYAQYPTDMHSAYEGMIVKGRMLANEYIRAFTEYELTDVMKADDPTLLVDLPKCAEGTLPTQEAVCWTDERTGEQREAECIPDDEPTPPPTQGPIVCENDDAAIVDLAKQKGKTVTGCTAVANASNGHYCSYVVVVNLCCEACAGQDAAGTRTLATGNPFDASQNETSDVSSSARQSRIWTTTFAAAGLAAMVVC